MNTIDIFKFQLVFLALVGLQGCSSLPDMHQDSGDDNILSWSQSISSNTLRANFVWSKPNSAAPYPTIIVHPGIRETAEDMRGLLIDLSKQGYLAVAIDYERRVNGDWEFSPMPLREKSEVDFVINHIAQYPLVDQNNIAMLGFSLGGAHSLRFAANNSNIKAVVAYYPMTDFIDWIDHVEKNFIWQFAIDRFHQGYLAEAEHHTDETHRELLSRYSAINFVDEINVPVLVIHGDKDRTAPLYHSEKLVSSLKQNGNSKTKLVVLKDTTHAFNFKRSENSVKSWYASLSWFNEHLGNSFRKISLIEGGDAVPVPNNTVVQTVGEYDAKS